MKDNVLRVTVRVGIVPSELWKSDLKLFIRQFVALDMDRLEIGALPFACGSWKLSTLSEHISRAVRHARQSLTSSRSASVFASVDI